MLQLSAQLHEQMKAHGAKSYPFEGCGLLLGRTENGVNRVEGILPATNTWPVEAEKPVRFQISADDMLKAEMEAMRRDLDIIGIFHSHPDHPPVASPRDLAWATWPGYSYIITQVWEGEATYSQSWQLLADRSGFVEEKIVETGDFQSPVSSSPLKIDLSNLKDLTNLNLFIRGGGLDHS